MKLLIFLFVLSFNIYSVDKNSLTVLMKTNKGNIELELFPKKAPKTVANFLKYVEKKFYDGTIYHRVIDNFMIQGGGFTTDLKKKTTSKPVDNEAKTGGKNLNGTIAMARTNDPHSATSQFFINVKDNHFLNYTSESKPGYTVFGKVTKGMSVVNMIKKVGTKSNGPFRNLPVENIIITEIRKLK